MAGGNGKSGGNVKGKQPDKSGKTGRRPDGKFAAGNGGMGGGRPKSRRSKVMEDAWDKHLTPEKASAIVAKTIACAVAGESWAVKEIHDRSLGKPAQEVNVKAQVNISDDPFGILGDAKVMSAIDRAIAGRAQGDPMAVSRSSRS